MSADNGTGVLRIYVTGTCEGLPDIVEALGNHEGAEEHYNEVAANDYTYLDVAERLRRLI